MNWSWRMMKQGSIWRLGTGPVITPTKRKKSAGEVGG
jgi:hypothetical protein